MTHAVKHPLTTGTPESRSGRRQGLGGHRRTSRKRRFFVADRALVRRSRSVASARASKRERLRRAGSVLVLVQSSTRTRLPLSMATTPGLPWRSFSGYGRLAMRGGHRTSRLRRGRGSLALVLALAAIVLASCGDSDTSPAGSSADVTSTSSEAGKGREQFVLKTSVRFPKSGDATGE